MRPRAVAALVLLMAACGDDEPSVHEERRDQASDAALDAGLPDDVADVIGLAAGASGATYSVTYDLGDMTVVVTQDPPNRRIDVTHADGSIDTELAVDGAATVCTDPPDDRPPDCASVGAATNLGFLDDDAIAGFIRAVTEAIDEYDFMVETRAVAGTEAQCVVTTSRADGGVSALCFADTGALLLVDRAAGSLEATAYSTDVDAAAFDLPAR